MERHSGFSRIAVVTGIILLFTVPIAIAVFFNRIKTLPKNESHAATFLSSQSAHVAPDRKATIVAVTTVTEAVTLHIPSLNSQTTAMTTNGGLVHYAQIPDLPSGRHTYYFTFEKEGQTQTSDSYDLFVP